MKLLQLQNVFIRFMAFLFLLACVVQFQQFGSATLGFFNLYTAVLVAGAAGALLLMKTPDENETALTPLQMLAIALVFGLHFVIRLQEVTHFSMWYDELAQMYSAATRPFIDASGLHFQPPLGYMFEKLSLVFFGSNDFAARSSTVLCSLLGVVLFFAFLLKRTGSIAVAFLLSCLLSFEPRFLNYSIDARPLALAFLLLVFILIELFEQQRPSPVRLGSLLVLFLLSLGLQPQLMLVAVAVGLVWCKKPVQVKTILVALLLFLPLQFKIMQDSAWKLPPFSAETIWQRVLHFQFSNYNEIKDLYLKYLLLLLITVALAVLVRKADKFRLKLSFVLTLVFWLGAVLFFSVLVNYHFAPHYVLLGLVPLLLTVACSYEVLLQACKGKRWPKVIFPIVLLAVLPGFNLRYRQSNDYPIMHEDLRSAYQLLLQESHGRDLALTLSFPLKGWSPVERNLGSLPYFHQQKVLLNKSYAQMAPIGELPLLDLYNRLKARENLSGIYIIVQQAFNQVQPDLQGLSPRYFEHLAVVHLANPEGDIRKVWFEFLAQLERTQGLQDSWIFNLMQIQKSFLTGDQKAFQQHYELFLKNTLGVDNPEYGIEKVRRFIQAEAQTAFAGRL